MALVNSSIVRGALAGAIATVPLTMGLSKAFGRLSPVSGTVVSGSTITDATADRFAEKRNIASHFGFGALCGIVYSLVFAKMRARTEARGAVFGLAVWGTSYFGWLPALGLAPASWRRSRQKTGLLMIAHVIWGVSLARLALRDTRDLVRDALGAATSRSRGRRWMESALA